MEMGRNIQYQMEELVPVVARLAEKYTGFESSSISYEKAQQLMEAVLFCISEYENAQKLEEGSFGGGERSAENTKVCAEKGRARQEEGRGEIYRREILSAPEAYERGYELVVQKARAANELYGRIMENFCDYGNRAYRDTLVKGMPEFFLRYDARFAPQEELLLLDYPVPELSADLRGIDLIYEYLCCIEKEQEFLGSFPEGYVQQLCKAYHEDYEELFINLAEVVRETKIQPQ